MLTHKTSQQSVCRGWTFLCIWRPTINLRCLPHFLTTWVFDNKVPCSAWRFHFINTGWWVWSLYFSVLTPQPGHFQAWHLPMVAEDPNFDLHSATTLPTKFSPSFDSFLPPSCVSWILVTRGNLKVAVPVCWLFPSPRLCLSVSYVPQAGSSGQHLSDVFSLKCHLSLPSPRGR